MQPPFFLDVDMPAGEGLAQDGIEDCKVMAGYGVVGNPPENATAEELANWDTLECEVGFWSSGGGLTTPCTSCPGKRTTQGAATTSQTDCNSEYAVQYVL
jgi:hypothetical protein